MNTRIATGLAVIVVTGVIASVPAYAGPHGGPMGGGPGFGGMGDGPGMVLPLILRHADLTADQQTQVRQIMDANRQQLHALFDQLHAANDALLNKLLSPGALQAEDLQPQLQHIAQLRQQLMQQGLNNALAIRALLKSDQLAKVAQVKDQMQQLHSQMRALMEPN